jgi:hypothetical protein
MPAKKKTTSPPPPARRPARAGRARGAAEAATKAATPKPAAKARPAAATPRTPPVPRAAAAARKSAAAKPRAVSARPAAARPRASAGRASRRAPAARPRAVGAPPEAPPAEALPETYGANRVRLLPKDPDSLFAFWDVDPRSKRALARELGRRGAALARLTLRVGGEDGAPPQVVLLGEGDRSRHLRADPTRASYRAELGYTLASGEFRRLAVSDPVSLPPAGESPVPASRRVRFDPRALPEDVPLDAGAGPRPQGGAEGARAGATRPTSRGGASETYRR